MPRIVLLADTHRQHRKLTIPECDLLIHAGDFCSFEKNDEAVLADAEEWFAELPAQKCLAVGGNHDFLLHRKEFTFNQVTILQDQLLEWEGLSIYGSPWIPDLSRFAYHLQADELLAKWQAIPSNIDILITHTPPWGILDLRCERIMPLGCRHLADELKRIKPRLHVFGHVHESHGELHQDGTHFVNAAVAGGPDLQIRNKPTVVDWA